MIRPPTIHSVRFGSAAAALLILIGSAAVGAAVSATNSPPTVRVTFERLVLEVPRGWTIERHPTCTSGTSALRLSSPSFSEPLEWVTIEMIPRVGSSPACLAGEKVYPLTPRVSIVHVVIHGVGVTRLVGPGVLPKHVEWLVPTLHVVLVGVGPDLSRIVHTLRRSS